MGVPCQASLSQLGLGKETWWEHHLSTEIQDHVDPALRPSNSTGQHFAPRLLSRSGPKLRTTEYMQHRFCCNFRSRIRRWWQVISSQPAVHTGGAWDAPRRNVTNTMQEHSRKKMLAQIAKNLRASLLAEPNASAPSRDTGDLRICSMVDVWSQRCIRHSNTELTCPAGMIAEPLTTGDAHCTFVMLNCI